MKASTSAIPASDSFFKARSGYIKPETAAKKNIFSNTIAALAPKEKRRFALLTFFDIVINCIDILSLALLLLVIQFYIQPTQSRLVSFLPAWMVNKNSLTFITLFFFLFTVKNLVAFFIAKAQNDFVASVAVRISQDKLSNYQNAAFEEFVHIDSSVHIRGIGFQPFDFCQQMLTGIQQIITQASLILITVVAIIFFNAKLFLLLLIILLPPVIGVFYFIKKKLTNNKLQIKTSNQLSFQYLMDALKGYVESNIYNKNIFFLKRFTSHRKKFSQHLFDSLSLQTLPGRLIEIFAVMGLFILIVIARWAGNDHNEALITVGAFMAAAYKIIPGIVKIVNTASQIKAYEFSLSDLAVDESGSESLQTKTVEPIQSIELSNVSFQYNDSPVLNNISFNIKTGDFLGITGRSGKGKTTILNLLLGFLSPVNGKIFINDLQVDQQNLKQFWPSISYVRQQTFFIHDTMLRNITLEEDDFDEERFQSAIKISGLENFISNASERAHIIITENGKNISGGQQQRIALARALYKDACLILLDEPFNELDEESELLLLHHFRQLANSGRIVAMITHNKKALEFCNKIVSLDAE